jgi:hypothetical protein
MKNGRGLMDEETLSQDLAVRCSNVGKIFVPDTLDDAVMNSVYKYIEGRVDKSPGKYFDRAFAKYIKDNKDVVITVKNFANAVDGIMDDILSKEKANADFKRILGQTKARMEKN